MLSIQTCLATGSIALLTLLALPMTTSAQTGGDQIVDGIGETSLLARYLLDGKPNDRSRNTLNGDLGGADVSFIDHPRFGKVLSLPGSNEAALNLPAKMLDGADAVSVTGWVQLRDAGRPQQFFSFEKDGSTSFSCTLTDTNAAEGLHANVTTGGPAAEQKVAAANLRLSRWSHVAVVLDPSAKTLAIYVDGAQVARKSDIDISVEKLFGKGDAQAAKLRVGAGVGGLMRDVRFYSIALSDTQVATIHRNGLGRQSSSRPARPAATSRPTELIMVDFGGPKLLTVPDITARTIAGFLPKLPAMIAGSYEGNATGPDVRVVWPAPKSNADVLSAGTYTVVGSVPGTTFAPKAVVTVAAADAGDTDAPTPQRVLRPFGLGDVTLDNDLNGKPTPFMKNRDKFVITMAQTNADDFLYMFRDAFGQPQPASAKPLGVWDSQTTRLRGHATGHYLSAIAQAYASTTYDPALHKAFAGKMNYLIDTLYGLSKMSGTPKDPGGPSNTDPTKVPPGAGRAGYDSDLSAENIRTDYWNWGTGFISAYPPDQFIMLENGANYGGGNNQIWAPYYTLHKIIAGLLDCYEIGGNPKALEVAKGMGLWTVERLKTLPDATRIAMWNRYIAGEYGGMNEVMARLNRLTGDSRFLEGAKLFDNIDFFYGDLAHHAGLAKNVDTLRGKHANQHIPQIIGALETYASTHAPEYFRIAGNFWDITTNSYTYSIGGVAGASTPNNAECFPAEPDTLWKNGFAEGGQNETCATYNMLKLSRDLFQYEPGQAKYINYYERALFNDILASVAEKDPGNTYHIPLNPGTRKSFGNEDMSGFTCCNGTALESNTKMQDTIYFRKEDQPAIYVNLFIPSTVTWKERNLTLKQETNFPYADSSRLTMKGGNGVDLMVRVPDWATNGFIVKINGVEKPVNATPDSYLSLGRDWKDGDVIELRMPFGFRLNRVMDRPNMASVMFGPIVLAAEEPAPRSDWRSVALDAKDLSKTITGSAASLRFSIGDLTLKPFFESYGRYSVYFDVKAK